MKFLSTLSLLLFLGVSAFAQKFTNQTQALRNSIQRFDSALVQNDQQSLKKLLHQHLSLGHSNGLIESKTELMQHLQNSYLNYQSIKLIDTPSIQFVQHIATVRRKVKVNGTLQTKAFEVKLQVSETWLKRKGQWQLLNRQSTKIN